MDDLLSEFLIETSNRLAALDAQISRFPATPGDTRTQAELRDLFHTVKGTSSFLALPRLEAIAEAAEALLVKAEAGDVPATARFAETVVKALDVVRRILRGLATGSDELTGDDTELMALIGAAGAEATVAAEAASLPRHVPAPPEPEKRADTPVPPKALTIQAAPAAVSSVSLPIDRFERFAGLVGDLVLTRNTLTHLMRERDDPDLEDSVQRLSHIASDLGSSVVATRRQLLGEAASETAHAFEIVLAVTVASGGRRYAIPQRNVVELVWVTPSGGMGTANDEFRFLRLREQRYPWVRLSTILGTEMDRTLARRREIVIMIRAGEEMLGLSVEHVFDAEEIVVRPQPPILKDIPFFSGNAVLGDGSIAMMLDPAALAAELKSRRHRAVAAHASADGLPSR